MTTSTTGLLPAQQYLSAQSVGGPADRSLSALQRIIATCSLIVIVGSLTLAQAHRENAADPVEGAESVAIENAGVPVEIDGRPVLIIYAPIGGFTPQERAEGIQIRIIALGKRRDIAPDAIHAEDRGTWTEVMAGTDRIMGITAGDAKAAERTRPELAAEYTEIIRRVVKQYREDHTWRKILWGILYALLATAAVAGFLAFLF